LPIWLTKSIIVEMESGSSAVPDTDPTSAEQLQLNLEQAPTAVQNTATVVPFVDAQTRAVRRDAIERVRNSGIFEPPNSLPPR
jgi:hypothetical protein